MNIHFKGGRLIIGNISLSLTDAWELMSFFKEIQEVCGKVLSRHYCYTEGRLHKRWRRRHKVLITRLKRMGVK